MSDSEPDEEEKDVQACVRRKREVQVRACCSLFVLFFALFFICFQVEQDSVKARELEEMEEEECLEKMPPKAPLLLLSFEEILGPEGLEKLNALEFKYLEYDSQPTSQTIRHFTMIIREGPGRSENERMVALFALRHFEGIKSLRRVAEMTTSGSFSGKSGGGLFDVAHTPIVATLRCFLDAFKFVLHSPWEHTQVGGRSECSGDAFGTCCRGA